MTSVHFLTDLDQARLDIRGSRDPLGIVPLWGHFGREIVGNLTTPSTSVRGFTTLLLGLYFAEQVAPPGHEREKRRLNAFLMFEQLAGYVRWKVNGDGNLRGITEVRRRIGEQKKIRLSAESSAQILSNQRTYGLWGLYMLPARSSGLVDEGETTLSPDAREFVEKNYLHFLSGKGSRDGSRIRDLLRQSSAHIEPDGREKPLFAALGHVLSPQFTSAERDFYRDSLVLGGPAAKKPPAWQPMFAQAMERTLKVNRSFDHSDLSALIDRFSRDPITSPISEHLGKIRDLELFIVPASNLFGFLQTRDGQGFDHVVRELAKTWGKRLSFVRHDRLDAMRADLAHVFPKADAVSRLTRLAGALHDADFASAITAVLEHNEHVMDERGGAAPWIRLGRGKRFDVRYSAEREAALLSPAELRSAWRSTYYINALKSVSDEIRAR